LLVFGEVGIDDLQDPFGGIRHWWHLQSYGGEIVGDVVASTTVTQFAFSHEVDLVEDIECLGGRLMNGRNDNQLDIRDNRSD